MAEQQQSDQAAAGLPDTGMSPVLLSPGLHNPAQRLVMPRLQSMNPRVRPSCDAQERSRAS